MPPVAGRPRRVLSAPAVALVAAALLGTLAACDTTSLPVSTQRVAGVTEGAPTQVAGRSGAPAGTTQPGETAPPLIDPEPTAEPPRTTSIVPGVVDRTSLDLIATYRVNAAITVRTGALDVTTAITVRNDSGAGIDRLELNTVAARLGRMTIISSTVDDAPVDTTTTDQTIVLPLGGVLPPGATTLVRLEYRATLRDGTTGSDWLFSRSGGTLTLYRWIPWVSVATPFDRPNAGQPFVTASSPRVDVELLADARLVLAAPTADVDEYAAGDGNAWTFSLADVRDVAIVLAPEFQVARGTAGGVPVRAFSRPGGTSAGQLLDLAVRAIEAEADQLGTAFPAGSLTIVDTPAGVGLESPGMVWVPRKLDRLNRTYAIYQGVAHQWFYGLVGSDQRAEPFADEAPADLLARTVLGTLRASRCGQVALDRPLSSYKASCYYEQVFVQGGRVLDDLRRRMGSADFWAALRAYLAEHRNGVGGTKELLEALRAGTKVDLLPVLRSRFPSLY